MVDKYECPLCNSHISKEKFERVTGIWKTIKEQEEEFKKKQQELEQQKKKVLEQIKKREKEWKKEKQEILKKAEKEAVAKVGKEHKKELLEAEKKARTKGKLEQKKKIDTLIVNTQKLMKEKEQIEKKYREALKKGKTLQEMGLDYEKQLKEELEKAFSEDKILKKGQKGDLLHIVLHNDKEISRILYECKKVQRWKDEYAITLKEAVLSREVEYGIIVTSALKKGKRGFYRVGEKVYAINPEGIIDFVKFLRQGIVKINSLKITQEERDILMKHLWDYMESNEFRNSISDVIDKAKELKDILDKEQEVHKRIWDRRIKYYKQIGENSSEIKNKVGAILQAKKKIPIIVKYRKKSKKKERE